MTDLRASLLLAIGSLITSLLAGEVTIRVLGHRDPDGNFVVRGRVLRPHVPPVEHTRRLVAEYQVATANVLTYDPDLGWAPRPLSASHDGLYRFDAMGARTGSSSPRPLASAAGTQRVLLFGDSFTEGDDVPFEETWGFQLERSLNEAGLRTEVVNLGVGGYGMDQALLRWRKIGDRLGAHVVVFGFQAENVVRNVNILRPLLWWGSGLPFSKPRFALQDGSLRLINSPALPPERILDVLASLAEWPLREYEGRYRPDDFRPRWWSASKLASFTVDLATDRFRPVTERSPYAVEGEPARLALAIVKQFEQEVTSSGGSFVVVHLPKREDLDRTVANRPLEYQELLAEIGRHHRLVDTTADLLARTGVEGLSDLFVSPFNGHYSATGNAAVAVAATRALTAIRLHEMTGSAPTALRWRQ